MSLLFCFLSVFSLSLCHPLHLSQACHSNSACATRCIGTIEKFIEIVDGCNKVKLECIKSKVARPLKITKIQKAFYLDILDLSVCSLCVFSLSSSLCHPLHLSQACHSNSACATRCIGTIDKFIELVDGCHKVKLDCI